MRPSSQPNRRLRICQMARPVTGGCKVLEDPNRRGDEVVLFWRSELLTDLVCLTLAPANANSQLRFEPRRWAGQQAALATSEGLHLILRLRHNAQYRLLFPGPDPPRYGSPLAIVIEPNRVLALPCRSGRAVPRGRRSSAASVPAPAMAADFAGGDSAPHIHHLGYRPRTDRRERARDRRLALRGESVQRGVVEPCRPQRVAALASHRPQLCVGPLPRASARPPSALIGNPLWSVCAQRSSTIPSPRPRADAGR